MFSTSPFTNRSTPSPSPEPKFPNSIVYPPTPPLEPYSTLINSHFSSATSPRPIPGSRNISAAHRLATPPLTPDSGADVGDISGNDGQRSNDALDFLLTIFPRDGLVALPYTKSVAITAPNMGATFDGVVLQMPGKPKVLYVDGKTAQSVSLRERCVFSITVICYISYLLSRHFSIVALLDLADECFQCSALVIALDKSSPALGDILHSFMYVGGNIVTKPPFQVDPAYLLVGMEI
jgi:Ornithine decarboxylase antizyme